MWARCSLGVEDIRGSGLMHGLQVLLVATPTDAFYALVFSSLSNRGHFGLWFGLQRLGQVHRVSFLKEELPLATWMLWAFLQLEPAWAVKSEQMTANMNNDLKEKVEAWVR